MRYRRRSMHAGRIKPCCDCGLGILARLGALVYFGASRTAILCSIWVCRVTYFMQGETTERCRTLCAQAALEQDVDKLIELTQEICRLLQEKEQRLRQRQSPESADAVA